MSEGKVYMVSSGGWTYYFTIVSENTAEYTDNSGYKGTIGSTKDHLGSDIYNQLVKQGAIKDGKFVISNGVVPRYEVNGPQEALPSFVVDIQFHYDCMAYSKHTKTETVEAESADVAAEKVLIKYPNSKLVNCTRE